MSPRAVGLGATAGLGCVGTLELSALWTDWSVGLDGQRRVQGAGTLGTRCAPRRALYGATYTCAAPATTRPIRSRTRRELRGKQQGTAHRSPLHTNQTPNGRRRDAKDVVALLNTHIYGTTRHIYVLLGGRSRRSVPHLDSPPSLRSSALPIIDICSHALVVSFTPRSAKGRLARARVLAAPRLEECASPYPPARLVARQTHQRTSTDTQRCRVCPSPTAAVRGHPACRCKAAAHTPH